MSKHFPDFFMRKASLILAASVMALSLSLPALAQNTAGTMATSASSKMKEKEGKKVKTVVNGTCMAGAVSKRDTAISSALQLVVSAIQKRGADESAAWTNNDKTALKAANQAFMGIWKTFDQSRKAAWDQFKTEASACKTTGGMTNTDAPAGPSGL